MADRGKFVAVALLTRSELEGFGNALRFVLPIEETPDDLGALLAKIDEADKKRQSPRKAE
ncbi:MAG: hypothetical protein ACK4K7_02195 [Allosphingosinicella sp.]|uniref:hypothetical protein n=1 Tax=Allosphingosinicella sp. TaxID=2823234 RepID=UPI00392F391E